MIPRNLRKILLKTKTVEGYNLYLLTSRGLVFNDNKRVKLSHISYLALKKSRGGYEDLSLQTIKMDKIKVMFLFEKKKT